jgi:sugar/nucleoside kinase (ribokinase family)
MDLLTIGDVAIDLYMKINTQSGLPEGNEGVDKRICFFHGSKIPVEHFETAVAGNSLNVSVGCHKMGLKTAIYSELGDDANGLLVEEELKKVGVETKFCTKTKGAATNVNSVIIYGNDRTIFSYHAERNYKIRGWGKPRWIYYTSMGKGFEDFQTELIEHLRNKPGTGIAFNPGTIQMKYGLESFRNILKITDILFVNREEAEKLVGKESTEVLHEKLHTLGPKMTVITDTVNGASCYDGTNTLFQKSYSDERPIADKTGAGDAFASGFLSAIFYGKPAEMALKWGVINAGSIIKEIGTTKGLRTKVEVEEIAKSL